MPVENLSALPLPRANLTPANKENTPLQTPSFTAIMKKGASDATKKRTITTAFGDEIDLNTTFTATPAIIEAMKQRIIELEDALNAAQEEPPRKRAKTTGSAPVEANGPSTSGSSKAEEKKRKMHLKKIFDRLKKECKSDSCKFQGSLKSIKFDEILDVADFDSIFSGKGILIQPTPTNKPKSTVTIIEFHSATHFQELFGDELKTLKGNRWTRGGIPMRSFGAGFGGLGSTFSKSVKQGAVDVSIHALEVNYSKNSMKCTLKFQVGEVGGSSFGCFGDYGDYDSDY